MKPAYDQVLASRATPGSGKGAEPNESNVMKAATPKATVLIVDDSDIARLSMLKLCAEAGMETLELASPIGATRMIVNHNVNVVVIDVLMPGMRGDRLAALFRGNTRFRSLVVILVSGENGVDLARIAKEAGADAAVSKAQLNELVPAIRSAVRRRAALNG